MNLKLYYVILPIVTLMFISCSSTYRVTDYKSQSEFYKNVNKHINDRKVNIILDNDSTFTTNENGAQLNEKNLLSLTLYRTVTDTTIPTNEIKNIDYNTNFRSPSAQLKLKNGTTINAENVRMSKDYIEFNTKLRYLYNIPINKVNEISYETHLLSTVEGFFIGPLVGVWIGATGLIFKPKNGGNPPLQVDTGTAAILGALTGIIIGPILGYIIGLHYNYELK